MWALVLRILAYILGIIGGVSFLVTVISRLFYGPTYTLAGVCARSLINFSEACLVFSVALGVAAIVEMLSKKKT